MNIHSLKLKNFKGFFDENTFIFNKPNGIAGSGLNIFIGENNCGKSTILEAIDFLRDGSKKSQDLLKYKDSNGVQSQHAEVELEFEGDVERTISLFAQPNKVKVFNEHIYQCNSAKNYLKLKRATSDQKTIELWKQRETIFENVSGIDASIKKYLKRILFGQILIRLIKHHLEHPHYVECY